MVNKGTRARLGATDSGARPGCFPLGSALSRAAARALLVSRESEEVRYQAAASILDGKPVNLSGLADVIRAGRMKCRDGESPDMLPAIEGGRDRGEERRPDCLAERIRLARERVARARG